MIQCRRNTFETNSSSMHSLVITKNMSNYSCNLIDEQLKAKATWYAEDGYMYETTSKGDVIAQPKEYGWGVDLLYCPQDKLDYITTLILLNVVDNSLFYTDINERDFNEIEKQFYNSKEYQRLNECFNTYADCNVVLRKVYEDVDIDHQSMKTLDSFLTDNDTTLEQYLFNRHIYLLIGNDNNM